MKNSNLIYLGIGVAAGLLFNSEKGKEIQAETKNALKEGWETAVSEGKDLMQTAQASMKNIKETGNDYLNSVNAKQVTDQDISQFMDQKIDEFKTSLLETINDKIVNSEARKVA